MKKPIAKIQLKKASEHFQRARKAFEFADTDPLVEPLQICAWSKGHTDKNTLKSGMPEKCKEIGCKGWGSKQSCPLGRFMPMIENRLNDDKK